MGRGSYTASDWASLRSSRKLTDASRTENVFTAKSARMTYDVCHITCRESRDSEDSPHATPVIIGFDVTASMGYLAKELSVHAVNQAVMSLRRGKAVTDPQFLCAAIGDRKSDKTPLQVTQFESDIRIIRQLTDLYLEGGGGGNYGESYHLLWYFAAYRTAADCFEKRGEKGLLFTIGDDACHPQLTAAEIRRVFGAGNAYTLSNEELIAAAEKHWQLFHIHIETGSDYSAAVLRQWLTLLPGRVAVIHKNNIRDLASLLDVLSQMAAGVTANEALRSLNQDDAEQLAHSVALIDLQSKEQDNIITF